MRLAALEVIRAGLHGDRDGAASVLTDQDPTLVALSLMDMAVLLLRESDANAEHFLDLLALYEMDGRPWTNFLAYGD